MKIIQLRQLLIFTQFNSIQLFFFIILPLFFLEPPDGITPTVGFSNANLTIANCNVTLYDLGGGVNVRTVWKKYFADVSKLQIYHFYCYYNDNDKQLEYSK